MDAKKIHAGTIMRLLILSTKLPYPPRDGGAIATLNLASGLADAGLEVSMLTFNTLKHHTNPEDIPAGLRNKIRFYAIDKDTSIRPLKALCNLFFSRRPYIAERYMDSKFRDQLVDLVTSSHFDFVQLEGPYLGQYIPDIRKHTTAGISLRAHNVEHLIWKRRQHNATGPLRKFYFGLLAARIKRLEMEIIHKIDMLVPISSPDAEVLVREQQLPTIIIPAGLDLSEYSLTSGGAGNEICFIGALDWAPNQEGLAWFIDLVLPRVLEKKPGAQLHVAGRNAPQGIINLLAHPAVVYHGEVADAHTYMRNFGILAVPLLTGSGIRIKILEGMAMGMCIVTTHTGAAGLPAQDGTHLFTEDDPEQFANRLLEYMDNPASRNSIGRAARKMIQEKFDTFTIASRLAAFYKKLA